MVGAVVGELNDDGNSVPACSGAVGMVVSSARGVEEEMDPRGLLLERVGRDVGVMALVTVSGERTERAGVDAGMLSVDESTGELEPSSE